MKDNSFTSGVFTNTWLKHFNNSEPGISFDFLPKLLFVRHKIPKLYINCGKTHTKGISYLLSSKNVRDFHNKVFLIYDVPAYSNAVTEIENKNLRFNRTKQYQGFPLEFENTGI
jgi:hypothetical protein